MPTSTPTRATAERHADAYAKRVAARLNDGLNEVHPDISERLRFAREQALAKKRAAPTVAVPSLQTAGAGAQVQHVRGKVLAMAGGPGKSGDGEGSGGSGAALMLFILAMILLFGGALVSVENASRQVAEQEIAEVDTQLLVDELPPQAYTDPGFVQYLRTAAQQ